MAVSASFYKVAEQRVSWLTWAIGMAGTAAAYVGWSPRASAGVAAGTALGWLSGLWLRQVTEALARLSVAQAGAPKPRVSPWVYIRFLARYGLIALVIYVMFSRFAIPVVSVLLGLLALGFAAMAEGIYEAVRRPTR
jgi:hypothetical protein